MNSQPAFRLFGFPVHVRSGFYLFMIIVVVANGTPLGLWLAGFLAGLTLLHELGHAFAARATGARAEISLDFLAGYASFVPTRPLKRWERAGISFAGPAIQIVVSVIGLWALGVKHLSYPTGESYAIQALWFAGPLIGLYNLLPILPFDGGNIVLAGLEGVLGKSARVIMLYASFAITVVGGAVALFVLNDTRFGRMAVYAAIFPLLAQVQMLRAHREPPSGAAAAAIAESAAWRDGDLSRLIPQQIPSPWYRAYQHLHHGDPDSARAELLGAFTDPAAPRWMPPAAADERVLESLVALLPRPLPTGNTYAELALTDILLRLGEYDAAAHYAADSYHRSASPVSALAVARSAAALGDRETAIGWLRAAETLGGAAWISEALNDAPELAQIAGGRAAAGELGSR
jgi:Zn-dependent protease